MQKTISLLIILTVFLVSLIIIGAAPTLAQQPDTSPKGPEPTPNLALPTPTPPPVTWPQLDEKLLRKIEPQLLKKLTTANGEPVPFIVYLKEKADLAVAASAETDVLSQRVAVINELQQTAQNSQAGVLQALTNPAPGSISSQSTAATEIKPLWIVNAVAAKGTLNTVLEMAARPDVEIVRLDKEVYLDRPIPQNQAQSAVAAAPNLQPVPEWGISKIRADLVHNALGIDGSGVVVANIDTGVDWLHPDLQAQYRGFKQPSHAPYWYDATGDGAQYPIDGNGHGSHTMGTMVGSNGIGVAPGAQWIAARAFNSSGSAQNSWLHAAFQWMLAPNNQPALAPDIVNNSWGSNFGGSTEFQPDVQALLNAGILPIFSAGNSGPGQGTVGSPGSLNNAFAVGATDINDNITNFSSRGPSPWGKIKPEVSAPGKNVRSTLPGGTYGNFDGTSMAAPHVSGVAALMLQASPALSGNLPAIVQVLTSTAIPFGSPSPNNNYGWGRVDAYSAVMAVASVGVLQGVVTNATTSAAIANAQINIVPSLSGPAIQTLSNAAGGYVQGLAANSYDARASAFGYTPSGWVKFLDVTTGTATIQNFSLTPAASGTLSGTVVDKISGTPLTATITVENTPVSTSTTGGNYSLQLPVGVYTVTVVAAQHRISKTLVTVITNSVTIQNFWLDSAPAILLVDSGQWYQESQIGYYQQALGDNLYPADLWQITAPFDTPTDVPTANDLAPYDLVIWSAPYDSPGYLNADDALTEYLDGGGKLLLSGQDVAYYDAGGSFFGSSTYVNDYLKATYIQDDSQERDIAGVANEPLAGLSFSISGGDGANNQDFPDVIALTDPDFAGPLLVYDPSQALAGVHIGQCVPYRAIFWPFGFEAINSRPDRTNVMGQAIDWLLSAPPQASINFNPEQATLIGKFGTVVSHTLRLSNNGTLSDDIALTLTPAGPYNWPTGSLPASVTLGACQSQMLTVTVALPAVAGWHITDTFTVTAQSSLNPALTKTITRHTKTPAPVLLVDDDRWYSFAQEFKDALAANNIAYDYWYVPKSWSGPVPPSPPLDTLQMYPMTVWYTAYDWFQPLTPTEEDRLAAYLDGGGRLLFSSQDYLYRHLQQNQGNYATFATDYLGILAHTEDYSSTQTTGEPTNPVGAYLGPYALTFPANYRNWTDALTPTDIANTATRGQANQVNGLTKAGIGPGDKAWQTMFLAYGPELLDSSNRARFMQRAMGWLSWLGSSTIVPEVAAVANGATITYTVTISNNGWQPIAAAAFTATFPGYLTPQAASPGINFGGGVFTWSGPLAVNESQSFTYTAQINQSLPIGSVISQTSWLAYPEHNILFDRVTAINIAPNLSTSAMSVTPTIELEGNSPLTYTIVLKNNGTTDAPTITTTNLLPTILTLEQVIFNSAGVIVTDSQGLTWTMSLAQNGVATLTFRAIISAAGGGIIKNTAEVEDAVNQPVMLVAEAAFKQKPVYLPVIMK